LNDLECPIQLKVRFTDGTLDVRLLRVSDSTVRISVARGGRRSGLEGLAHSVWAADALFLCGSSASCYVQPKSVYSSGFKISVTVNCIFSTRASVYRPFKPFKVTDFGKIPSKARMRLPIPS